MRLFPISMRSGMYSSVHATRLLQRQELAMVYWPSPAIVVMSECGASARWSTTPSTTAWTRATRSSTAVRPTITSSPQMGRQVRPCHDPAGLAHKIGQCRVLHVREPERPPGAVCGAPPYVECEVAHAHHQPVAASP